MRASRAILSAVLLVVTSSEPLLAQGAEEIRLVAPNGAWELRFPGQRWTLKESKRSRDGNGRYVRYSAAGSGLIVSFSIEPATKCRTGTECRDLFWSNPGPGYRGAKALERLELNGFAVMKCVVPVRVGAVAGEQLNYSAHMVRDGYWIDVHLSNLLSEAGDRAAFTSFVESLRVEPVAAVTVSDVRPRRYPLPDHGSFELRVPGAWADEVRQPPNRLPPTIVFRPRSGAAFQILLTPLWSARSDAPPPPRDAIRRRVEGAAEYAKRQAVETALSVNELTGTSGLGYYFSATDRAPAPGEYRYMTQGMISVGVLAVTFTILTNEAQSGVVDDALAMLSRAAHVADTPPADSTR